MGLSRLRKRPCGICRRWFLPKLRSRRRQKVCSNPHCQRERHRRACAGWHRRNPDYDRDRRLRDKLLRPAGQIAADRGVEVDPLRALSWPDVRDVVGLQQSVFVEEVAKVIIKWLRDAVAPHHIVIKRKSPKVPATDVRDEIASSRVPP